MEEVWKDIVGYEGLYKVSNKGRVRSLPRVRVGKRNAAVPVKGRIMKLNLHKNGYLAVELSKDNVRKAHLVHRIVAIAFIENKDKSKDCVDHIDGNRSNNIIENLRWCTKQENMNFDLARENISKSNRASEKCHNHILSLGRKSSKKVEITYADGRKKVFESILEAYRNGFYRQSVRDCCNGKRDSYKGCKFRFV